MVNIFLFLFSTNKLLAVSYKSHTMVNNILTMESESKGNRSCSEDPGESLLVNSGATKPLPTKPPRFFGSCRFRLVILCLFGIILIMYLRYNLSMAIVCMSENESTTKLNYENYTYNMSSPEGTASTDFAEVG